MQEHGYIITLAILVILIMIGYWYVNKLRKKLDEEEARAKLNAQIAKDLKTTKLEKAVWSIHAQIIEHCTDKHLAEAIRAQTSTAYENYLRWKSRGNNAEPDQFSHCMYELQHNRTLYIMGSMIRVGTRSGLILDGQQYLDVANINIPDWQDEKLT